MIKHFKRLKAIIDLVPENKKIIDIGCDHGYIDIYLTKEKNCKCLATDISEKAISQAIKNFNKENLKIDTKVTDGLNNIKLDDQIIILSGMGTNKVLKILDKKITNDLIISSNNDLYQLRKEMYKKGYYIYKEKNIYDDRYYNITYFKYGKDKDIDYLIGTDINNKEYMKYLYQKYTKLNKYKNYTKTLEKLKKILN